MVPATSVPASGLPDLAVPSYQIACGIEVPNALVDKSVASGIAGISIVCEQEQQRLPSVLNLSEQLAATKRLCCGLLFQRHQDYG
jgi:hypothetical protein